MNYKFKKGQAGIKVEIYLPKKAEYQGTLYETLVKGLRLNYKEHFLKGEKRKEINELLKAYTDIHSYTEDQIELFQKQFPNIFNGYSMYEVDGVFKSSTLENLVYEERTQVIKLLFVPDYEKIKENYPDWEIFEILKLSQRFFRHAHVNKDAFWKDSENNNINYLQKEGAREIIQYLSNYVNCSALIVFGYIVFEITKKLDKMLDEKRDRIGKDSKLKPIEEEIWVTSEWSFTVNKVIYQNGLN